jgi:hypothetical protein
MAWAPLWLDHIGKAQGVRYEFRREYIAIMMMRFTSFKMLQRFYLHWF